MENVDPSTITRFLHAPYIIKIERRWQMYEDHAERAKEEEERREVKEREEREKKMTKRKKVFQIMQQREEGMAITLVNSLVVESFDTLCIIHHIVLLTDQSVGSRLSIEISQIYKGQIEHAT